MSKSTYSTLYRFFLSRGQYEKIAQDWAEENKNIINEFGYAALMHFFPEQTLAEDKEACEELAYLRATCGRDK